MEAKVMNILDNVQTGSVNHQKNIKLLENVYNSVPFEKFLEYFLMIIQGVLQQDYKNPCFKLLLEFLAKFVGHIARVQGPQDVSELEDDPPTHPFLTAVIREVVRHHSLPLPECRYNACSFVSQTLQNIGDRTQIDSQICDVIQVAMLDNIQDYKPVIRLQAVLALVRLQDPLNPECPVIRAYTICLKDSSPLVRRETVKRIAPNALTIPKLKDRTTDTDANVRSAAFTHVAEIGIRHFKIVHRQFILKSGFSETNRHVRKVFMEYLLPKWLTALNGEYIAFLTAIKLDAEESDILNTEELSKKIMEVFFHTEPIDNLIKALPLDENKVIPLNSMKTEIAHYWNILTKYLRKSEEMDEYLDAIIPELTTFCNYLEKLIGTKFSKTMEDWEYLDFQHTLYHLFDIAEHYDLSEEVGRRTLDNLLKKVLRNHRLQPRLLSKIVQIASKLASSMDSFTTEMCLIISDIREPLTEQEPSANEKREKDFKIAELTVKVNILEGDLEDAIDEKDFQKAQVLKNEIEEYRRKMEALNSQTVQTEKVRVSKDDQETVCWCLDLLAAVLIHSNLKTLSPSLVTCREEFLKPLIPSKNVEIGWRVFKCLAAYCVFDKKMAEEHVKQLMVPIASYRVIPNFNKTVLIVSVSIITDLIRLHGTQFFCTEDEQNTTSSTQASTRRRLYNEEVDDVGTISNQMSVEVIVNVVLDMLDDENDEIRDTAVVAVAKLILNEFTVNPMVMTRLILKWYNPVTQKTLQQKLGMIIKGYTERTKDSKEIVAKSVIPILTNIADAPRTSPLAEVDIENVIRFLAAITDSESTNGITHTHRNLAHILIREIASRPADVVTPYLAKMLNVLNIAPDNLSPTKELLAQAELLLEREALDKGPKQYIVKFMDKLHGNLTMVNSVNTTDTPNNESVGQSSVNTTVPRRLSSVIEEHEEEIIAGGNEKSRTEEGDKDIPSKKRRVEPPNSNKNDMERKIASHDENQERSETNKGEAQDKQSDVAQTVTSVQKTCELLQKPVRSSGTDPDVISPSISPDSQEQTINNLRKRTRSNTNIQTTQSKKKKVNADVPIRTTRNNKKERSKVNRNNKEVQPEDDKEEQEEIEGIESGENLLTKDKKNSAGNSKRTNNKSNDNKNTQSVPVKKVNENSEDKSKNKKKNKDKSGNKEIVSTQSSNSSSSSNNVNRSLRVVVTNNIASSTLQNSNKENSSESQKSVEPSSSDGRLGVDKIPSVTTSKQNPNSNFQGSVDNVSTSSESPLLNNNRKKRGRPGIKSGVLEKSNFLSKKNTNTQPHLVENAETQRRSLRTDILQSSSSESLLNARSRSRSMGSTPVREQEIGLKQGGNKKTNAGVQSEKKVVGRPKKVRDQQRHAGANILQSSSSESSLDIRSRSRSMDSALVREQEKRLNQGVNKKTNLGIQSEKKAVGRPKKSSSSISTLNTSSELISISSQSSSNAVENRLRPREDGKTPATKDNSTRKHTGNRPSRLNQIIPDKCSETENSKGVKKSLFVNNNSTSSQSSVDKVNKGRKGRKKEEKGLNNNRVGGKEVEVRANGVQKTVQKSVNTPQVKRKKARGAKKVAEESKEMCEDLFNSSEQSLHTIIEPSEDQISLLADDSPENSPQKSLRNSRRLQVVVSETSSDSESTNSPVRRSSRKKKASSRFQ